MSGKEEIKFDRKHWEGLPDTVRLRYMTDYNTIKVDDRKLIAVVFKKENISKLSPDQQAVVAKKGYKVYVANTEPVPQGEDLYEKPVVANGGTKTVAVLMAEPGVPTSWEITLDQMNKELPSLKIPVSSIKKEDYLAMSSEVRKAHYGDNGMIYCFQGSNILVPESATWVWDEIAEKKIQDNKKVERKKHPLPSLNEWVMGILFSGE